MSGNRDPIADLKRNIGAGGAPPPPANNAGPTLAVVWPVPEDAPPRLEAHRKAGHPATWWAYRDERGALLHWEARFNLGGGRKHILPLTLWREPGGKLRWDWKGLPEPRHLYGLDRLAQAGPTAPVLLAEGEKAADAAAALFPDSAAMTWHGGTNAAGKADWRPLAGRRVVIWPDNDEPGQKAARAVLDRLRAVGAVAGIVAPPWDRFPTAWDLADPFPEGFDLAAAQAVAAEALAALADTVSPEAQEGATWPPGYAMHADSFYKVHHREGEGERLERIADPFDVLGEVHEPDGRGWGIRLKLGGPRAAGQEVTVWRSQMAGAGTEVKAQLAALGLYVKPGGRTDYLIPALMDVRGVQRRFLSVRRTGWLVPGGQFIIPGREHAGAVIFDGPSNYRFAQRGDLEGWRASVAAPAVGNPLLAFALSLSFVGPLARLLDWRGGGFHLRGPSSCGKTTLAEAAGSVWGGGGELGFAHSWRRTDNAIEGLAEGHNDCLLVLDELGQVAPEAASSAVYTLANGQAKARAQAGGGNRTRAEWRVPFLSTGELPLGEHIASGRVGGAVKAGQELRFLDLEADAGSGLGVWYRLGGYTSAAEMSDQVRAAAQAHFGHAGPAFVDALQSEDLAQLKAAALMTHGDFVRRVRQDGDSGQVGRAADRFAQVAAAGELAAGLGLLPWPKGEANRAVQWVFERWADGFGREHTAEERKVFQALRGKLERHATRFAGRDEVTEEEKRQASLEQWGWRDAGTAAGDCFIVNTSAWSSEIFNGVATAQTAAKALHKVGFLVPDDSPEGLTKRRLQRKYRKQRAYWVKAEFLESDLGF
ncbi:DUF927 domain-containing protein [Phenylobacterium sp.]|uniref:DUF927 domain-containing protein n=1 Tax=Phenylobacterium sp. TaxID=1871053 RepID=UPI0025D80F56|nr:DUF927 domain-containing protein [Phenylobacterium sp.]MCA6346850.1 DUF927 domain-containing protein [Phenylobacterium sp.]MCA6351707.1 DUF927 domain-containing protein [Phenylobacterium sp.]MCA6355301.1 DUF927 domain-containing protein [Phenylobacterium sp.]MCA6358313.1 DUF927 domain-containing protein [Phenylobacterium sp.]MCA6361190.1 DUF927 domain-containing protein [Phenylobacterium sp.]